MIAAETRHAVRARARQRARAAIGVSVAVLVALLLAACGTTSTAAPAGSATPNGSASPAAAATGASDGLPTATPWPGNVAGAVISIGGVDSQLAAAAQDMDAGVQAKDVGRIRGAADGLRTLLDSTHDAIATAQAYPATRSMADAFDGAFVKMRQGAQSIVDGVDKNDATAINGGFTTLGDGLKLYASARILLSPLLEQAIDQQKKYVK